jgi:DNA-binding transcriptional regulator YiaG
MESIKEARKRAGLSQAKMSELLEIPRRTIEDWDRGVSSPPHWAERLIIEKLDSIAAARQAEEADNTPLL